MSDMFNSCAFNSGLVDFYDEDGEKLASEFRAEGNKARGMNVMSALDSLEETQRHVIAQDMTSKDYIELGIESNEASILGLMPPGPVGVQAFSNVRYLIS